MENDNFDNVSWGADNGGGSSGAVSPGMEGDTSHVATPRGARSGSSSSGIPQAGPNADELDTAGVGDSVLHCTVTSPLKENDGSKDAFISYLITTTVGGPQTNSCLRMLMRDSRQISHPFKSQSLLFADASPTSSSCGNN